MCDMEKRSLSNIGGAKGEEIAAKWYKKKGFRVLQQNYRTPLGEIDLIVEKRGRWLVFVEVKTRTGTPLARPCEAVDARKQRKLIAAAQQYLCDIPQTEENIRFDVMEIWLDEKGHPTISCIENAFWL